MKKEIYDLKYKKAENYIKDQLITVSSISKYNDNS